MLVGTRTSRWDKKATPGIQMHLCSFDRFQKALMYWCFRFWPPLCHLLCMIHSPLEAWSSVPSRYKTVRLGRWCCHLWDEKPFCGLITDLLVEFLKGSREMLWHVLALMFTLTMSSSVLHSCPKYGQRSGWSRDSAGPVWKCEYWHSSVLLGAPLSL